MIDEKRGWRLKKLRREKKREKIFWVPKMSIAPLRVILITGAAGFIGSAVTNYMVRKYPHWLFYGLDKITYCSNINNLQESKICRNFEFIEGDISNKDFMHHIFYKYGIDTVLHFAAYSHVDHSFGNSLIFTTNNVVGTHTLLEVCKQNKEKIKRFIHVSTDEVYGDNETDSDEKTILCPTNPYAASKAAAEHIVRSYYHSFGLPIIITRGNNVYGPRQYPEKVVPRFCMRLSKNAKCHIQGNGEQTRSFLYIDDVVEAFDIILNNGVVGEIYNIGSKDEIKIIDLANKLISMSHPDADPKSFILLANDRDFNDKRYSITTNKLEELGWKQSTPFDIGLQRTFDWYKSNPSYWKGNELSQALELNVRQNI